MFAKCFCWFRLLGVRCPLQGRRACAVCIAVRLAVAAYSVPKAIREIDREMKEANGQI